MATQRIQLAPKKVYHFYNHANGNDNLFRNEGNYHYFMKKYAEYLSPVFDTFAYCLLPNHFHFLIRVKDEKTVAESLNTINPKGFEKPLGFLLAHRVGSFQNAYAKAFNKQQNRKGSLFMQSFGRRLVEDEGYYLRLIRYIHANAVHHRLADNIKNWKYSSYHAYLTAKETRMNREEVLSWFGGSADFIKFHEKEFDKNLVLGMEEKP